MRSRGHVASSDTGRLANGANSAVGSGMRALTRRTSDARRRVDEWADVIRRQAKEHPGRSVALALGAGYVLGGGLFSALTARLVGAGARFALRVALVPMLTQSLAALGRDTRSSSDNSDDAPHSRTKESSHDHKEKES